MDALVRLQGSLGSRESAEQQVAGMAALASKQEAAASASPGGFLSVACPSLLAFLSASPCVCCVCLSTPPPLSAATCRAIGKRAGMPIGPPRTIR